MSSLSLDMSEDMYRGLKDRAFLSGRSIEEEALKILKGTVSSNLEVVSTDTLSTLRSAANGVIYADTLEEVGNYFSEYRAVNNMSPADVAHRVGISEEIYLGIESGKFYNDLNTYFDIAEIFGLVIHSMPFGE